MEINHELYQIASAKHGNDLKYPVFFSFDKLVKDPKFELKQDQWEDDYADFDDVMSLYFSSNKTCDTLRLFFTLVIILNGRKGYFAKGLAGENDYSENNISVWVDMLAQELKISANGDMAHGVPYKGSGKVNGSRIRAAMYYILDILRYYTSAPYPTPVLTVLSPFCFIGRDISYITIKGTEAGVGYLNQWDDLYYADIIVRDLFTGEEMTFSVELGEDKLYSGDEITYEFPDTANIPYSLYEIRVDNFPTTIIFSYEAIKKDFSEVKGVPPFEFPALGDDLVDWYIRGATGGVGNLGINYLKLEEKEINNQCADPSKNGYVRMSFHNGPDAPSDSGHDSSYTQWIGMGYEYKEIGGGNSKRYYDDRPMGYDYAQYYTTLNPGSYKLIFEGYCPTTNISWKGCPECRDGSDSYSNPDNAVIHLYSHNHPENYGESLLNFTEWCNTFKTYSINTPPDNIGVNGINGGSGEYTENSIIMTKNSVDYHMFPLSYNYGGAGTIPQVGLWPTKQSNPYNRGYFIRFNIQSSSPISSLKIVLRKNTSTTVFVDEDITNLIDEDGNVEYHFVTTEKYIQFTPCVLLANNVEGETVTISNIGIYLDENGIVNYEIIPEDHSSERFIHQELPFTLTETDTLGLFFLRFVGSGLGLNHEWYSRFMIIDANVPTETFDITYNSKNYTGVSCWEPYSVTIPVVITSEDGAESVINLSVSEPLGPEDILTMTEAGVSIPTYEGLNTIDVDTTIKPSEVYVKFR